MILYNENEILVRDTVIETMDGVSIKNIELAVRIATSLLKRQKSIAVDAIAGTLEKMVENGDLIEIEYCEPFMPDRIKSFYLPKGSSISAIRGTLGKDMP